MSKRNTEPAQSNAVSGLKLEAAVIESGSAITLEDVKSVGSRICWGAILAGVAVSLGIYFLLGVLGAAVGVSISDQTNPTTLTNGAITWAVLTTCVALFFGGVVASVFTVGENKLEAMLYGIIMWAVLLAFFVGLGAAGVKTGFNAMAELSNQARLGNTPKWEAAAADAGVPREQIEKWRASEAGVKSAPNTAISAETVTRISWYSFIGIWLSMMTAALGSLVGAGPTFRFAGFYPIARSVSAPLPGYRS